MGTRNKGGLIGGFDQLRAPDAPTISVTTGDSQLQVAFTNPSDVGGGAISSYTATAIASGVSTGATSSSSPVTITGLTNGTSYSVTGLANNAFGASPYSSASSVSPSLITQEIGLFFNGFGGSNINQIDKITITSTGNATDFGDTSTASRRNCAFGGATRGIGQIGSAGAIFENQPRSKTGIEEFNKAIDAIGISGRDMEYIFLICLLTNYFLSVFTCLTSIHLVFDLCSLV